MQYTASVPQWKSGESTDGGERDWVPILGKARCIHGQRHTHITQMQCVWWPFLWLPGLLGRPLNLVFGSVIVSV